MFLNKLCVIFAAGVFIGAWGGRRICPPLKSRSSPRAAGGARHKAVPRPEKPACIIKGSALPADPKNMNFEKNPKNGIK